MLAVSLLCSMFAMGVAATDYVSVPVDELEKKFVVDGNLDIWYLSDGDEQGEEDYNTYHYTTLDPYIKMNSAGNGVNFYPEYETAAQVWTAWDDDYIYIYAKVWDDEIVNWDPEGVHSFTTDSAYVDSVELWVDPDPNSQTHTYIYDANGKIMEELPKASADIKDGWWAQTEDPAQGDFQVRWLPGTKEVHGYHPVEKPGYGMNFRDWVNNPENFCYFTFEDEPVFVDGIFEDVYSGFGVEARFPRNDDKSNAYVINVAANNSAEEEFERYALATGAAWWQDYLRGWKVDFLEENPFFNQSAAQLAAKAENMMYTESYANVEGPAGKVVEAIDAMGTVGAGDRATVLPVAQSYVNLTALEKGYVNAKNFDKLAEAWEITGGGEWPEVGGEPTPDPDPTPDPTVTLGDVNGDGEIKANDALETLKAVVGKVILTADQEAAADVNKDGEVKANDALEILKKVVGKPTCF